ncbi:MAG: SAF domain-containing protein, partial [Verrucomicrobium sp.]|nr:SAF domain-containing protein [Verrucomicrobium sp.]
YGNIKGFLNHHPKEEDMAYWAKRNGISRTQVTSFTDGTKLQIEQALVANGLGGDIVQRGMLGPRDLDLDEAGHFLGAAATELGRPISDYVLNGKLPAGVFVVGEHPTERPEVLRYLKLGDGPYYTLLRPYHLCHLEMVRTIRRVLEGKGVLLNNSPKPRINVVALAKEDLPAGKLIESAIGSIELRGEAVRITECPDSPPIGLLSGARLRHSVAAGQTLRNSDVDIPNSLAKKAWDAIREQSLTLA